MAISETINLSSRQRAGLVRYTGAGVCISNFYRELSKVNLIIYQTLLTSLIHLILDFQKIKQPENNSIVKHKQSYTAANGNGRNVI